MAPFSKPETVLKQAEGLISVGQTHAALQSLTEMFNSKRFRSTPILSLEPIMIRFIELCVDLRKGRVAKEGIMQYKNIAQNSNVGSVEVVITKFVEMANDKVRDAQQRAGAALPTGGEGIDDLEASETPEDVLLGAVSSDASKDRTDRALVTPWLKFLWESYRSALETLKNNARLEAIYQNIALQAFRFCLTHKRKVEFRRLCETLRLHLQNVSKYSHQQHSINLSDADTLQRFLDTRFAQLNTSVELELWQEAFRSVEDIHNLLTMAKKSPKPSMMVNYYDKLRDIFMTSGSVLYHAAAWSKYYSIVRTLPGMKTDAELRECAGFVLLSALAVPSATEIVEDGEESKGKHARLTSLLGLNKVPTRSSLLNDALSKGVLKLCPEPLQELYEILEVQFEPIALCTNASPILKFVSSSEAFSPYLSHLRRIVLSRLLSQLAQVYSSITISNLIELVEPLNDESYPEPFNQETVEAFIMGSAKRNELLVKVNHLEGSLTFLDDAFSTSAVAPNILASSVQPSPGQLVRSRLSRLAECLHTSLEVIAPDPKPPIASQMKAILAAVRAERTALQVRRSIVARRRELLAELVARRQSEERSQLAEQNRRAAEELQKKKKADALREAMKRAQDEIDRKKKEENEKIVTSLQERGALKNVNVDELDTDKLLQLRVEQVDKDKREADERKRIIAKRIDHIERAMRKAELPLLADDYARQQEEDRINFESTRQATIEAARQAHQETLATKTRLTQMLPNYQLYANRMATQRDSDYQKKLEEATRKILEEKTKLRKTVLAEREKEAKHRAEQERIRREREEEEERLDRERIAEEERKAAEEEAHRLEAEKKKREEEERLAAQRRKREEEREAALEQARLRQQREDEALERRNAARREATKAPATPPTNEWRKAAPAVPTRMAESTPPRTSIGSAPQSPRTPSSAVPAAGKYVPPSRQAEGGGAALPPKAAGGWRERERMREMAVANDNNSRPGTPGRHSPAPPPHAANDDAHPPARKQAPTGGAYRPPGARANR